MNFLNFLMAADTQQAVDSVKTTVAEKINAFSNMPVDDILRTVTVAVLGFVWKIALAVAIYYFGRWIIKKIKNLMNKIFERRDIDPSLSSFLISLVNISLTLFLIIIVIGLLGIQTSSFIALFAAAGVAVGMALSGTLQNFAGGVMILLLKPFKVGDYIEAQGQSGKVEEINIFNTILTTADNRTIIVPNGGLSTGIVNNKSSQPERRVEWKFGIAYGDNLDTARKKITAIIESDGRVLKSPAYKIGVAGVAGNVVTLSVQAWVKNEDFGAVFAEINEKAYRTLSEKGKDDQPPQSEIHLTQQA